MNPNKEHKKKQYIVYGAIVLLALLLMLVVPAFFKKDSKDSEKVPELKLTEPQELESKSFKATYGTELVDVKQKNEELRRELEQIKKELETERMRKAEAPLPPPTITSPSITSPQAQQSSMPYVPPPDLQAQEGKTPIEPLKDLIVMEKHKSEKPITEVAESSVPKGSKVQLPAGTIIKAVLLSGMDAPTGGNARSQPHPVLFKVMDLAILPNLFKSDIRECFVIGSGYGDLSSERAYIRLETLSCMTEDKIMIETPVKGYVTGEDGKVGLQGRVVTKQGQMLARALIAGFLEGVANAYRQANTVVQVSPTGTVSTIPPEKALETGLYAGAGTATQRLADFYMKLVNEMYPVIEINAGRNVDLILTSGINETTKQSEGEQNG